MSESLYGNFRTRKFTDIFPTSTDFINGYKTSGLYATNNKITDTSANTLYYLIYSRFGNSTIASSDETQFKYKVYANIFKFGPNWEKKIDVQNTLRGLTETELLTGSRQINNHSFNPSTEPSTSSIDELTTINEQSTMGFKKSKMDAYALLMSLLETDVTEEFLNKFRNLFLVIVEPQDPLWYQTEEQL